MTSPFDPDASAKSGQPCATGASDTAAGARFPIAMAVQLQDDLLTACSDLDRLQVLLADASATLMRSFGAAADHIRGCRDAGADPFVDAALRGVDEQLARAVTALQFEDIASQLIEHTLQRVRHCCDRLANEAFRDDDEGAAIIEPAPMRSNPVAQTEMDGGAIDLF